MDPLNPRIDIHDDAQLHEWAKKFDVTPDQIREAVQAVGDAAADVEMHLKGSRAAFAPHWAPPDQVRNRLKNEVPLISGMSGSSRSHRLGRHAPSACCACLRAAAISLKRFR